MGKIMLWAVFIFSLPLILPLFWLTNRESKPTGDFLGECWDQVVGEKPDFVCFLVCCVCAMLTALGLAIAGLIAAYITKG